MENTTKIVIGKRKISYSKWGYIFIAAFFVVYTVFTLYPQLKTIYESFFDYTNLVGQLTDEKAPFCGFDNYVRLFTPTQYNHYILILKYLGNTVLMWVIGAIPQFVLAIILALIFTSTRLKLKFLGAFKSIYYMPNLIMASAFSALVWVLFGSVGPVHKFLFDQGLISESYDIVQHYGIYLVAGMNFLMWFGNTTILLMAGIQGIDESLFESARIDGANSRRVLFDITLPLLKPIVVYVFITSMIGGLQMYDVPHVLIGKGAQYLYDEEITLVMYLGIYIRNNNYGMAGAVSVVLFLFTMAVSLIFFKVINRKEA